MAKYNTMYQGKVLNVFLVKLCWHWTLLNEHANIIIVLSYLVVLTLHAAWHITQLWFLIDQGLIHFVLQ